MSHFWILLELEVMEMVVTTGATRRAKHRHMMSMVQSSSQIVTTENQRPLFFYTRNAVPVVQPVVSEHGRKLFAIGLKLLAFIC